MLYMTNHVQAVFLGLSATPCCWTWNVAPAAHMLGAEGSQASPAQRQDLDAALHKIQRLIADGGGSLKMNLHRPELHLCASAKDLHTCSRALQAAWPKHPAKPTEDFILSSCYRLFVHACSSVCGRSLQFWYCRCLP